MKYGIKALIAVKQAVCLDLQDKKRHIQSAPVSPKL